jgi:uncharacterized membrane protein YqjE
MIGSIVLLSCPSVVSATHVATTAVRGDGSQDALGAAVALAFMGASSFIFVVKRAMAVRRTYLSSRHKVDADRDLLRSAARHQRARGIILAVACIVAMLSIVALPIAREIRLVLGVTPALLSIAVLATLWRVLRVLRASADTAVDVTSHGHFLFAARGTTLVGWLAVPPRVVARVIALPVAQLRRLQRVRP